MRKPESLLQALIVGVEDASTLPPLKAAHLSKAEIIMVAQEIMPSVVAFLAEQGEKS